jgi:hypothetical protein
LQPKSGGDAEREEPTGARRFEGKNQTGASQMDVVNPYREAKRGSDRKPTPKASTLGAEPERITKNLQKPSIWRLLEVARTGRNRQEES